MKIHVKVLSLAAMLLLPYMAAGESLRGNVIGVADGDTMTILDQARNQVKIRLAAIDAPEKVQPFGQRSKQSLSNLCFGKQASIDVVDVDRYGRSVGVVSCEGTNANEAQVKSGMAWVYRKYAKGFDHLYRLEEAAKSARLGLWAGSNPVPPWEWRKARR